MQIKDVKGVWKEKVEEEGRIELVRYAKFADGQTIKDRERFPYFDFNSNGYSRGAPLGYRIWWYGCQRCGAWRKVIQDILIDRGDLPAFKLAISVLVLSRERWMDYFVCEDCMRLRKLGVRRDPFSKMFLDWGPEGFYPLPFRQDWRDIAANMNRFGEKRIFSSP